jgi:hypothetical protein
VCPTTGLPSAVSTWSSGRIVEQSPASFRATVLGGALGVAEDGGVRVGLFAELLGVAACFASDVHPAMDTASMTAVAPTASFRGQTRSIDQR